MSDAEWIDVPDKQIVTLVVILRDGSQITRRSSRDEAVGLAHLFRTRDMKVPATGSLVTSAGVALFNMDDIAAIEISEGNIAKASKLLEEIDAT